MTFSISSAVLLAAMLLATRLAPVFLFAPPLSSVPLPTTAKALVVFVLAMSLVPLVPAQAMHFEGLTSFGLISMFVTELVSGSFIAFGLIGAFSAISVAGRLIDLQVGFGVANLFDPVTNSQGPMIGAALAMLAAAFFFATDSHLLLFRLMAESTVAFPPGHSIIAAADGLWATKQFAYMFFAGVALAFPILLVLLMIDVGLGLASRSVPQLGVFFLSLPIKSIIGLAALAMLLMVNPGAFSAVVGRWFSYMTELLGA